MIIPLSDNLEALPDRSAVPGDNGLLAWLLISEAEWSSMGFDLIFMGEGRESGTRFSWVEWDVLDRLEAFLPDPVAMVAGGSRAEMNTSETLPVVGLLEAIDQIDGFLAGRNHLLPETYTFKCEYLCLNGNRFPIDEDFVTGGMSGIELPGDPDHRYSIQAGVDECHITKIAIDLGGRGRPVGRRDLRGEEELVTITCGRIQFCKRSDHSGLRGEFARIREFLESLSGATVTKTISG